MAEREEEEKLALYEAYNELHGLAQEFQTPFDAPAVLVVGHQTDGKSALVEALMGFQFNHVGGGTKTRRPITLHMKYDPLRESPVCRLISDSDPTIAVEKSLCEIQVLFLCNFSFQFQTSISVAMLVLMYVCVGNVVSYYVNYGNLWDLSCHFWNLE